jgi:predicted signal transduction protein with EAL and GGDEF domain
VDGPDDLYARADAAMYQAKHAGRDRLALSGAVFAGPAAEPRTETAA